MNIESIHNNWGSIIEFDNPLKFFDEDIGFWRTLLYEKKLLVFKKMKFSKEDYAKFSWYFGQPWTDKEYQSSYEQVENVNVNGEVLTISPFSNLISKKLGLNMMPWHSDIPTCQDHPFPIRSLWMISNPNPYSGLTSWLNIEEGLSSLSSSLSNQLNDIKIIHQSWYDRTEIPQPFDFVKIHPITGNRSLRLNFFRDDSGDNEDAWIKNVILRNNILDPGIILKSYYRELTSKKNLLYTHKWDNFDIVIFDNWSFVHSRTALKFNPSLERKFYRTNIKHLTDIQWMDHIYNSPVFK